MREILFKAKRIDNGEWVEGYAVRYGYNGKEKWCIVPDYASDLYAYEVDQNTICQYIGLTDKNGNKIWENDIVKCQDIIGKIRWNETHLAYTILANVEGSMQYYFIGERLSNEMEVISNIFDNPELLEGSK